MYSNIILVTGSTDDVKTFYNSNCLDNLTHLTFKHFMNSSTPDAENVTISFDLDDEDSAQATLIYFFTTKTWCVTEWLTTVSAVFETLIFELMFTDSSENNQHMLLYSEGCVM